MLLDEPLRYLCEMDGALVLSDVEQNRPLWTARDCGVRVAYSPHKRILAATTKGPQVHLLRASDGVILASLSTDTEWASPLAFSRDGSRLVTGGSDAIRLWDVEARQELFSLPTNGAMPASLVLTPDDAYLVARIPQPNGLLINEIWPCAPATAARRSQASAPRMRSVSRLSRSSDPRKRNRLEARYEFLMPGDASR
jgi:WD40 repeat protein